MNKVSKHQVDFEELGFQLMRPGKVYNSGVNVNRKRFVSWFGTDAFIVLIIWKFLFKSRWMECINQHKPEHLLWARNYMKTYATEANISSNFGGVDEKTIRKWVWFYICGIADLSCRVVSYFIIV